MSTHQLSLDLDIALSRNQVRPLDHALAIWNVLSAIPVGGAIPSNIMILDYDDNTIPTWIVREREASGDVFQVLTVIDASTIETDVFGQERAIAREVFTMPAKTLAAPQYLWTLGCVKRRDKLGDIRQHARQWNDKKALARV